eukprot:PhF_6_TR41981/c0_g1_i1/m.63493/K02183/CALM; calmodulin
MADKLSQEQIENFKKAFGASSIQNADDANVVVRKTLGEDFSEMLCMTHDTYAATSAKNEEPMEEELIEAFECFDENRTGKVSLEVCKAVLRNVCVGASEEEMEKLFTKEVLVDCDGNVVYRDVIKTMM